MSASKKNEAMQLLFTFAFSFLMCSLFGWILRLFRSRPSTLNHPILTYGLAGALATTIVVMWNNRARARRG